MINEKNSKYISIITMALAVIFIILSVVFFNPSNKDVSTTTTITEVLDKDSITEINIEIDESDWQWLIENATKEEYRSANITINGETFKNVGVRPKGNSSLSSVANDDTTDRYSLKIDFDQYVKGQTYHGIEALALNNNISDATYMKEYLSYDMYKFLEVPTPEYSYSNIKINDEDWGLYLGVEIIDERYIEKYYGDLEGNLYKPETMGVGENKGEQKGNMPENNQIPNGENMPKDFDNDMIKENPRGEFNPDKQIPENIGNDDENFLNENNNEPGVPGGMPGGGMGKNSNGADLKYIDDNIESYSTLRESSVFKSTTDEDFKKIIEMIKNLNEGTSLEEYINVEEVLKYFAVNTFLVNLDSYSGGMYHNYYLYEKDGVCEILPWDLNMSFAGFSMNDGAKAINFPIDSPVTGNLEDAPLIGKLLEVDEYKELYHSYLEKLAKEYFNNGIFTNTVTKLDKLIGDYVKNDNTAFYTYEEYKNAIPQLLTFGEDRTESVLAQLNGTQISTDYGDVGTTLDLKALGQQGMGGGMKGNKDNLQNEMLNIDENKKENDNKNEIPNKENMQRNIMDGYNGIAENSTKFSVESDIIIYGLAFILLIIAIVFVKKVH